MCEIWKPIQGYEDLYEVSSLGRVRVVEVRTAALTHSRLKPGQIINPELHTSGYLRIALYKNGVKRRYYVQVIVCIAFHGPKPSKDHIVNHKAPNGDKTNNREDNLEWVTYSENVKHSYEVLGNKAAHGPSHYAYGKKGRHSPHAKHYIATAPDGTRHRFKGLKAFCREHGLTVSAMSCLAAGTYVGKTHKGWRCQYATIADRIGR